MADNDKLTAFIHHKLTGQGVAPEPYPGHVTRDRGDEMLGAIQAALRSNYGWRSAGDLREADRIAREQAAQPPPAVGEDALAAMLAGLSAPTREAWDALIPEIQEAALRGDPAALETWGAVERSIVRGVPLSEIDLDEEEGDDG